MANTLDKENAELGLPRLDVLHEELPPVNGAVGGIQNTHSAALMEKIVQELIERVESHLLAELGGRFILGVKKLGRLVHLLAEFRIEVKHRRLALDNNVRAAGALGEDGRRLGRHIDSV